MTADDYSREELVAKLHEYAALHDAMEGEINRLNIQNTKLRETLARESGHLYDGTREEIEAKLAEAEDYIERMNKEIAMWVEQNNDLRADLVKAWDEIRRLRAGDEPLIVKSMACGD